MSHIFHTHYKSIFWLFCLVLNMAFSSCSNKKDTEIIDNYATLKINNKSVSDTLDLSKIIDSVELVKLTDAPQKPLASINQLYTLGDHYIAIDAINTKRVNAYTTSGKYVKTLMENGPLKTDALNVTDCYVNEKNEAIVYDYAQMKLTIFDSNLKIKKIVKGRTLFNYDHIASLPGTDNFVGYSSYYGYNAYLQHDKNNPSSLDILSSTLSLSKKHLYYPQQFGEISLVSLAKSFFPFQDSLRFFRTYDPYIYSLKKDKIERRYKIIYDEGNIPPDFLEKIIAPNLHVYQTIGRDPSSYKKLYSDFKGYTFLNNWLETDDMIYLSSMTFSDKTTNAINSIIVNKGLKPIILTAKVFSDRSKFKLTFPGFNAYDKEKNEFIAYCTGNNLKKYLYKNSPLIKPADIVDDSFYLIKVRFKRS